ncbi:hypothetical protein HELRODRAFT_186036 [Helobdella robusta]|uniref:Sodium/calcium exchanger membrane region domain-containing protein n=1 Tax=Helobdella robusta TaxID=6412 RepID=T1FNK6_HELRO|nr:hypothetical protein HELRODRAFT_186036 [Helobdella robusta]ESN94087.1 hypothetical protein HELRODRAFT_186036 [Helobdella robusta]
MSSFMITEANATYCSNIHNVNSSYQCSFARQTADCHIEEGIIEYTLFLYCLLPSNFLSVSVILLVIWLLFLFVALAVAASDFFCPSLIVIAKVLHMSDNIAGITLLAFGNGAPDVFSAIAAVQNMKHGDNSLLFGALLGAGVFLTTVVVGAIGISCPFKSMERPFLRDVSFYIATTFFTFFVCFMKSINTYEAGAFLAGYAFYVAVVLIGRFINKRYLRRGYQTLPGVDSADSPSSMSAERQDFINSDNFRSSSAASLVANNNLPQSGIYTEQLPEEYSNDTDSQVVIVEDEDLPFMPAARLAVFSDSSEPIRFLYAISPIDIVQWHNSGLFSRIYAIIKMPALFAFKLTVPVVDKSNPLHNWNKPLNMLHCITSLVFGVFATNYQFALKSINEVFPVYLIFLIAGLLLASVMFFTSSSSVPPKYHSVLAFVGFIVAVLWIKAIANEIVNLLQSVGIVLNISNAILGLTLLAWGNSIGDFISDVSMARRGYPRAGFSACYGGPLFNTLLGIGIPFIYVTATSPTRAVEVQFEPIHMVLFAALAVSLVSAIIFIPLNKFYVNRCYGIFLIALYVVFIVIAILVEQRVIKF